MSTPTTAELRTWRRYFESAWALLDILDRELQARAGVPLRWYDVLVHLEEAEGGRRRMGDLADQILASKSGLTRVIDNMERAGLVRRERPGGDRRVVEVVATDAGFEALAAARPFHRDDIRRYFADHLSEADFRAIETPLLKLRDAVRPERAGR